MALTAERKRLVNNSSVTLAFWGHDFTRVVREVAKCEHAIDDPLIGIKGQQS